MEKMLLHTAEPGPAHTGGGQNSGTDGAGSHGGSARPSHRPFSGAGSAGQEQGIAFCRGGRGGGQGEEWGRHHLSVLECPLEALLFTQCSG